MKKLLILAMLLLWVTPALALKNPDWVATYNGPVNGDDQAVGVAVDAQGNVFVTGKSWGGLPQTCWDYATVKYYPNGDTAWTIRYSGPGYIDQPTGIAVDASGNVIVTGMSEGSASDPDAPDYLTIKYNPNGNVAAGWPKRYDGPAHDQDWVEDVTVDGSGNVYVTGWSDGDASSDQNWDFATVKYSPSGAQQWAKRFNSSQNYSAEAYAIAVDGSGNVYVAGDGVWVNGQGDDYTTIKYYSNGDTAWVRRYSGTGFNDIPYAIAVDMNGNVYVTGGSQGISTGYDYATIKYSSNGNQVWAKRYEAPGDARARSIAVDGSGNVYVTGDCGTIKYNSSGVFKWIDGRPGKALALDSRDNIYVATTANGTIALSPQGSQLWTGLWGGVDIAIDHNDNVYVTGSSGGDYVTAKYGNNSMIFDLTVKRIEVNQAIQDDYNTVPLVAGKPTVVRVHVDPGKYAPAAGIPGPVVKLYYRKNGGAEQGPFLATIPGSRQFTAKKEYSNLEKFEGMDALNFYFDGAVNPVLSEGSYLFHAVIDPYPGEKDTINNQLSFDDIGFETVVAPSLLFFRARMHDETPSINSVQRLLPFLREVFPVSQLNTIISPDIIEGWSSEPIFLLFAVRDHFDLFNNANQNSKADYGIGVFPGFPFSGIGGYTHERHIIPIRDVALVTNYRNYYHVLPHELGHVVGEFETLLAPNECLGEEYWLDEWGSFPPSPGDQPKPYAFNWQVNPPPTNTTLGNDTGNYITGDAYDVINRHAAGWYQGDNSLYKTYGFMGNPEPYSKSWVTESEYRYLAWKFLSRQKSDKPEFDGPYVLFSGFVMFGDSIEIWSSYQFSGQHEIDSLSEGDYSVAFLDSLGSTISVNFFYADTCFDTAGFYLSLNYPQQTKSVVFKHLSQTMKQIYVSTHAPAVRVLSPNGGENWDGSHVINWTASDEDHDSLKYALWYCLSDTNCLLLASGITDTFYVWNTLDSPGGNFCKIRICASDGLNCSFDSSDAYFSVARKSPACLIAGPQDSSEYLQKQIVSLQGLGQDPEDGMLPDASLSWSSTTDGYLGTGGLLSVRNLSTGQHTIILTAQDSNGNLAADSILLTIVADSDSDGMSDVWETAQGLDPGLDDSQQDPDSDGLDNYSEHFYQTNPHIFDTDNDTYSDGEEVARESNPNDPESIPTIDFLSSFSLTYPINGIMVGDQTPSFVWQESNPYYPEANVSYLVYYSEDSLFSDAFSLYSDSNQTVLEYPLPNGIALYWKVKAFDNLGHFTWSSNVGFFLTDTTLTNQPPVITSGSAVSCKPGDTVNYVASAYDPEGDSLNLWFSNIPSWLNVSGNTISGPVKCEYQDTSFLLMASDGQLVDTQFVNITIDHSNVAPQIVSTDSIVIEALDTLKYFPGISDPDDSVHDIEYPWIPSWCQERHDSLWGIVPNSILTDSFAVIAKDYCNADTQAVNVYVYIRGDVNADGVINVTDVVYLINYLFLVPPGPAPVPQEAGDANCDGVINVTDVVYLINYLFLVPPGPPPCG
jgi:hypothetical protein